MLLIMMEQRCIYRVQIVTGNDHISVYSIVPTAFDLSSAGNFSHLVRILVCSHRNSQPWGIEFNDVGTKTFYGRFC